MLLEKFSRTIKASLALFIFIGQANPTFAGIFGTQSDEPVDVSAGTATYRWEIDRLILETARNQRPTIEQSGSTLIADTIIYDYETEIGYAYGNVVYTGADDNTVLTADEGTFYTDEEKVVMTGSPSLITEEGTEDEMTATADTMTFYSEHEYVVFTGNVEILSDDYEMTGEQATYYQNTGRFSSDGRSTASQNGKTITADSIDMISDNEGNETGDYVATGDVVVEDPEEGITIYCDRIESMSGEGGKNESYIATGNVVIENIPEDEDDESYEVHCGKAEYYEELGYVRMTEDPVLYFTDYDMTASALTMEQYDDENRANLLGDVVIEYGDLTTYSRWGEYSGDEDKIYLTGNPIITTSGSQFTSHLVELDLNTEDVNMIGGGTGYYVSDGDFSF